MADIAKGRPRAGRATLANLLLAGSAAVVLLLGWYLTILLGRIDFTGYGTSIGFDVVLGFHVLGVAAIATSALALRLARVRYGWAILLASIVVELSFLGLNLSGRVGEYRKAAAREPPGSLRAPPAALRSSHSACERSAAA